MPYENEHSCRLKPPNYSKYARKNCYKKHEGKSIDYIFGVISADESELQAMRYPKDIWTVDAARAHCKEASGTFEPAKEEEGAADEPERRYWPFSQEMRAFEDGEAMIIEGYPIVYDVYAPIGWFREIIRPGAAAKALKKADELVLWDHESGQPMARRSAGTLKVSEEEYGVFVRADVSKTRWGRDGYEAIKNKIITQMSFAFDLNGGREQWTKEEIEGVMIETREILAFGHLYDYSPVSYPAYPQTAVSARALELAVRNRPQPEVSGKVGAMVPEELERVRNAIVLERIEQSYLQKE